MDAQPVQPSMKPLWIAGPELIALPAMDSSTSRSRRSSLAGDVGSMRFTKTPPGMAPLAPLSRNTALCRLQLQHLKATPVYAHLEISKASSERYCFFNVPFLTSPCSRRCYDLRSAKKCRCSDLMPLSASRRARLSKGCHAKPWCPKPAYPCGQKRQKSVKLLGSFVFSTSAGFQWD